MIWLIPALFYAAVVYLLDLAVRRKRWKDNTEKQKKSLGMVLVCSVPYVFVSFYGLFVGAVGIRTESRLVEILHEISVFAAGITGIVCFIATIAAIILRKLEKDDASIRVQLAALIYCVLVVVVPIILEFF